MEALKQHQDDEQEKRRQFRLAIAIAIIVIELLSGLQTYLSPLIRPLFSAEFASQKYYGLTTGVLEVVGFIAFPLAVFLLHRFELKKLLTWVIIFIITGAIIRATAPNFWIFMFGSMVSSMASPVLGMVAMGAIAVGLSG